MHTIVTQNSMPICASWSERLLLTFKFRRQHSDHTLFMQKRKTMQDTFVEVFPVRTICREVPFHPTPIKYKLGKLEKHEYLSDMC